MPNRIRSTQELNAIDADLPEPIRFDELYSLDLKYEPTALMGTHRWMRRGAGGLIVGQSGIGISSFSTQLATCLALGKPFFGAPITHPLRVLYIHANPERGNIREQLAGIQEGFDLSYRERNLLSQNLLFEIETARSGLAFLEWVKAFIKARRTDVVRACPIYPDFGRE